MRSFYISSVMMALCFMAAPATAERGGAHNKEKADKAAAVHETAKKEWRIDARDRILSGLS